MNRIGYLVVLSIVLISGVSAQKSTDPRNDGPWNYDPSSNVVSAPAGSNVAIGTPCPAGAPSGSICMNGQAMTPISVSALPAASAVNANVIQVVSNTTNCTTTSGTNPMLCISTGTVWEPLGGGSASATPAANTIPMAGSSGTLSAGWIPVLNQSTTGNAATATSLTLGPALQADLVAEYRLDEGSGRRAFNSVYPHGTTNNLLGSLTAFSQGAGTNTPNYTANRDGVQIANRLQLTGSNIDYLTCSGLFVAGQTYVLSMDVISNTGVAQAFRLGTIYTGAVSSNISAGATWQRVSYTFTATSGSQYIIVYTDAAGDALDISFDRLQAEAGSVPTAFDSHLWHAQLGNSKWVADSSVPSWSSPPWLTFTGAQRAYANGNWNPVTLSAMSAYAVVQQTSDATPYQPVLSDDNQQVGIWANWSAPESYRVNFGSAAASPGGNIRVNDGNPHVLAETYDGATLTAYIDGVNVASTTAAVAPVTLNGIGLGNVANAYEYNGKIGYGSLYSTAHSGATVQSNTALLRARMAQLGVTIPAWRNWVLFEGDSITSNGWPYTAQAAISPFPQGRTASVPASRITDLVSRESPDNATLMASPTRNVLVVLAGANDQSEGAASFVASLKAYCLAQRAAGWNKIAVLTILPQTTSGFNAFRDAANALIVADTSFYDAIVRLDQDSVLGCDACAANTTYYNTDGIHPTTAGENLLAADVVPVLHSILQ